MFRPPYHRHGLARGLDEGLPCPPHELVLVISGSGRVESGDALEGAQGPLLAEFPEGYRHLAYLQTRIGYKVKRVMPGLKGPEVERLYAFGKDWLAGKPIKDYKE